MQTGNTGEDSGVGVLRIDVYMRIQRCMRVACVLVRLKRFSASHQYWNGSIDVHLLLWGEV